MRQGKASISISRFQPTRFIRSEENNLNVTMVQPISWYPGWPESVLVLRCGDEDPTAIEAISRRPNNKTIRVVKKIMSSAVPASGIRGFPMSCHQPIRCTAVVSQKISSANSKRSHCPLCAVTQWESSDSGIVSSTKNTSYREDSTTCGRNVG